jgi:hypothetical protein
VKVLRVVSWAARGLRNQQVLQGLSLFEKLFHESFCYVTRRASDGTEHTKPLALGGSSLGGVEGHEFQIGRTVAGDDEGSGDLKGVRGTDGMTLDKTFGMPPDDFDGSDLGPPCPRVDEIATGEP